METSASFEARSAPSSYPTIAGLLVAATLGHARAQQPAKVHRIAIVAVPLPIAEMTETSSFPFYRVFFHELRRSGYIEGRNLIVERCSVERPTVELAREVLRSKPDVIFSLGPWTAFLKTLTTIPIVAFLGDPVGHGLVVSLAHPGGNMTGVSVDAGPEVGLDVGKGLLEQIGPVTREEFLRGAAARGG